MRYLGYLLVVVGLMFWSVSCSMGTGYDALKGKTGEIVVGEDIGGFGEGISGGIDNIGEEIGEPVEGFEQRPYKNAFITLGETDGKIGGISGADKFCNDDTNKPASHGDYSAFISDGNDRYACSYGDCKGSSKTVDWVLLPNTEYRMLGGASGFVTNEKALFNKDSLSGRLSETGEQYWTGLNRDWSYSSNDCNNWKSRTSSKKGHHGTGDKTDMNAIYHRKEDCQSKKKLLCVEK